MPPKTTETCDILVIGGGPAGLMAAEMAASAGASVIVLEAMPTVGRKFLMAGKSGLNITNDRPIRPVLETYHNGRKICDLIDRFDAAAIRDWVHGLGRETFVGSSGHVFPVEMKASPLLRAWVARLEGLGVRIHTRTRWIGWGAPSGAYDAERAGEAVTYHARASILALGGASWSRLGSDGAWVSIFNNKDEEIVPFAPSNAALRVNWTAHMEPHFGSALKQVSVSAGYRGKLGECVITQHGLEGGAIYPLSDMVRQGRAVSMNLVPQMTPEPRIAAIAKGQKKKMSLGNILKSLGLDPAKRALFFECFDGQDKSAEGIAAALGALRIPYEGLAPLDEAISTSGGVSWAAITRSLSLKARPDVFVAGEMVDWDAPTGGYLLSGALAMGRQAGINAAASIGLPASQDAR